MHDAHPVQLSVDYPARDLNRVTTALRIFTVIPIGIVAASIGGYTASWANGTGNTSTIAIGGTGLLFFPPLLMIVFRQKYPRWWFRLEPAAAGVREPRRRLPGTDGRPVSRNRCRPSCASRLPVPRRSGRTRTAGCRSLRWLLAIPHYVVLLLLFVGAFFAVIVAWFAILITGRYPRGVFDYVEGVIRWYDRVVGYALILVTDDYPPFRLHP